MSIHLHIQGTYPCNGVDNESLGGEATRHVSPLTSEGSVDSWWLVISYMHNRARLELLNVCRRNAKSDSSVMDQ